MSVGWESVTDPVELKLFEELLMERCGFQPATDLLVAELQSYLLSEGYRLVNPRFKNGTLTSEGVERMRAE